jgi:hypothetical protein
MHADRSARRDESSFTTMPSRNVLVIRAHSRTSAVRLFGNLLNETAIPQIDTNARRLLGAARRIVAHDHAIKKCAGHPRAFARISGMAVR